MKYLLVIFVAISLFSISARKSSLPLHPVTDNYILVQPKDIDYNFEAVQHYKESVRWYKIRVTKQDCIGHSYTDIFGCPLFTAIKREIPGFPLELVGVSGVEDKYGRNWRFKEEWHSGKVRDLKDDKINYFDVIIFR